VVEGRLRPPQRGRGRLEVVPRLRQRGKPQQVRMRSIPPARPQEMRPISSTESSPSALMLDSSATATASCSMARR
jgi:hypothetical protein